MAFIKQYVRDHVILRTEPASNNVTDYGVNKAIEHLPALRELPAGGKWIRTSGSARDCPAVVAAALY